MADAVWYAGKDGEQKGPFTEDDVRGMIARGEVAASDLLWKDGMAEWTAASEVEEFADAVEEAPPPPPKTPTEIPGLDILKSFWASLRAILVNPEEGLNAAADRKDIVFAAIWVGLGVLVFALLNLQGRVPVATTVFRFGMNRFAIFGLAIIHGIVLYGLWFGALMLTLGPILKSEADWKDALSILGLSSIPTAGIGFVLFVLAWIHSFFAVLGILASALCRQDESIQEAAPQVLWKQVKSHCTRARRQTYYENPLVG